MFIFLAHFFFFGAILTASPREGHVECENSATVSAAVALSKLKHRIADSFFARLKRISHIFVYPKKFISIKCSSAHLSPITCHLCLLYHEWWWSRWVVSDRVGSRCLHRTDTWFWYVLLSLRRRKRQPYLQVDTDHTFFVCLLSRCYWSSGWRTVQSGAWMFWEFKVRVLCLLLCLLELCFKLCFLILQYRPVHGLIFLFKWVADDFSDGTRLTDESILAELFFAKQVWSICIIKFYFFEFLIKHHHLI